MPFETATVAAVMEEGEAVVAVRPYSKEADYFPYPRKLPDPFFSGKRVSIPVRLQTAWSASSYLNR